VYTSNKGFEEWGIAFGNEPMAAALSDRLLDHCDLVNSRGNSYCMRQHRYLALRRREPDAAPAGRPHCHER